MPRRAAILLGACVALLFSSVGVAAAAVEGTNSISAWTNPTATIDAGQSVTFKNTSTTTPHGVGWNASSPETPSCPGVVGSPGQAGPWEGNCTFQAAGSYPFMCTVHAGMTGTITVNSTGPEAPTVTTDAASAITQTGARLNGKVDPNGQSTEYFFEYGTTTGYGDETDPKDAGSGDSAVSKFEDITGLSPSTTYHFRLVATNATDTTEGADKTFTTASPPSPPLATTSPATGVSDTGATLQGSVTPRSLNTTYIFEWGTTTAYGTKTTSKSAGSGSTAVPASFPLTGLAPETTYHFKIVATNSAGTVEGADQSFTTAKTPSPPPPPPPPPPLPLDPPTTPVLPPSGPALGGATKVTAGKKGAPVKGSVEVLAAGAGGRLEVELKTKGAKGKVVGRTVKNGVSAGTVSFSVPLKASAKKTLKKKKKLPVIVTIELTPPSGPTDTVTRSLVLKG